MERFRWLPEFGERYLLVDIAAFRLTAWANGEQQLAMNTVVGKSYRQTPIFSGNMRYVVLNPSWDVPHKIASQDILARVQANPAYLAETGMQVFQGWGADQTPIDPAQVDWNALPPKTFPYRLRQPPGPKNALGKVKFMFPNEHSVYLHDTNAPELFNKSERSFSSGCIRLEKPLALLDYLFASHPTWNGERRAATLAGGKETTAMLAEPMPVHLVYLTANVNDSGDVVYRKDIYQRDSRILAGLGKAYRPDGS